MNALMKGTMMYMVTCRARARNKGLTAAGFDLLLVSMIHSGEIFSKSELAETVGISRAGLDKMIEKHEDLVAVEKLDEGHYSVMPTEKGAKYATAIMETEVVIYEEVHL